MCLLTAVPLPVAGYHQASSTNPVWQFTHFQDGTAGTSGPFAVGDATGDGIDDLLMELSYETNSYSKPTYELFAGGDSIFSREPLSKTPIEVAAFGGPDRPELSHAADFDGDGTADLVFEEWHPSPNGPSRTIDVLYGGRGGYPAAPNCTIPHQPPGVGMPVTWWDTTYYPGGDFDGDGLAEVAVLGTGSPESDPSTVVALLSPGVDCLYRWAAPFALGPEGGQPRVLWANFDADEHDEVVLAEPNATTDSEGHVSEASRLTIIQWANGSQSNATVFRTRLDGVGVAAVRLIDFDADGRDDVVWESADCGEDCTQESVNISWAMRRGTNVGLADTPVTLASIEYAWPGTPVGTTAHYDWVSGDFNGDGELDLLTTLARIPFCCDEERIGPMEFPVSFALALGLEGGLPARPHWTSQIDITVGDTHHRLGDVRVLPADIDGDSMDDVVVGISMPDNAFDLHVAVASGRRIAEDLGFVPVGFHGGIVYPTVEYGWNLTLRATSPSQYGELGISTPLGAINFDTSTGLFRYSPNSTAVDKTLLLLQPSSRAEWSDVTSTWKAEIRFQFNWTVPDGEAIRFAMFAKEGGQRGALQWLPMGAVRLEKDFTFSGDLVVTDRGTRSPVKEGAQLAAGAKLGFEGLKAVFEGSSLEVPGRFYNWVLDRSGEARTEQAGGVLQADMGVGWRGTPNTSITVTMAGVPDAGVAVPSLDFHFAVEATRPTTAPGFQLGFLVWILVAAAAAEVQARRSTRRGSAR